MKKTLEEVNRELQALYWEQIIAEACDGDLGAGRLGNPMRQTLTVGSLMMAGLMPAVWRGVGAFAEGAVC